MEDTLALIILAIALGAIAGIVSIPLTIQYFRDQRRYALDMAQFPAADLRPRENCPRWRRR